MSIERQYLNALELTHQMLSAAVKQDWDTLVKIEKERARIVEDTVSAKAALSIKEKQRISEIMANFEDESAEIMSRVKCWQKDVKILLRMED